MLWSPYFEYVALAILCVQFVFYRSQNFLPMMSNLSFSRTLYIEIMTVCLDIIASFTSSHYALHSVSILYVFNEAYFFCLFLFMNELSSYCRTLAESKAKVRTSYGYTYWVPIIIAAVITFTTHWTGFLFYITKQDGYIRGSMYYPIFTAYLIYYICFIFYYLYKYRKSIPVEQVRGLAICILFVYTGFIAQVYFFGYVLLVNIFSAIGLLILCLSLQNPAHDQDSRCGLNNINSFSTYSDELLRQGRSYTCVGFTFNAYQTYISKSGGHAKRHFLSQIGKLLTTQYDDYPAFYIHNGEFVLITLKNQNPSQLIKNLKSGLSELWNLGGNKIDPELRFVVLSSDMMKESEDDVTECLKMAFSEALKDNSQDVLTVENDLLKRLKEYQSASRLLTESVQNNTVEVYYQPIYDVKAHRIVSAEALARIPDGKGGIIFPDVFIPIAEKDGLILQLGMQVFEKVCIFISSHDMQKLGLQSININLSPLQCLHSSIAEDLLETAHRYHIDMRMVNFEITESSMMDIDLFHNVMQRLINAGSFFSLDDYGTGFSNLINVLSLPFHTVKIDKSIAWAYFQGNDQVLPEIIRMFLNRNLQILVEGLRHRKWHKNSSKCNVNLSRDIISLVPFLNKAS